MQYSHILVRAWPESAEDGQSFPLTGPQDWPAPPNGGLADSMPFGAINHLRCLSILPVLTSRRSCPRDAQRPPQVARAQRPLPWDADATRETHVVYSGTKPKTVIVTTVGPGP